MEQFWNQIDNLKDSTVFWILIILFISLSISTYIQEKKRPKK